MLYCYSVQVAVFSVQKWEFWQIFFENNKLYQKLLSTVGLMLGLFAFTWMQFSFLNSNIAKTSLTLTIFLHLTSSWKAYQRQYHRGVHLVRKSGKEKEWKKVYGGGDWGYLHVKINKDALPKWASFSTTKNA